MRTCMISLMVVMMASFHTTAQDLSPYIKIGETNESLQATSEAVVQALQTNAFTILGTYNPANNPSLLVIAFTRSDLKNTVVKIKDRGALAAIMKIGLVKKGQTIEMSYTNPEYMLRAYLMDEYAHYENTFKQFESDLKLALRTMGTEFEPFGGKVSANELKKYHYKIMMPYFTDPVALKEFNSFEQGLQTIERNLASGVGHTKAVYKLVYPYQQIAIFGVGLKSSEDGEAHFLPKIGEAHAAALPYEIILQGKEATMLHGKYRIALFWPDLTMGTFMKIMSTPGDIEDTMEQLCQ